MAERGDAQMIDNDQRERPSEFARRRRRHRQMRRRLMMAGKQLVESDDWHQRQQTTTMTSDNHRIGHRTGAPLMSMSMPMPSSDLAAEEIDAQLTRLRLHDELSRSGGNIASAAGQPTSASMRMLTSQAEMQQQQQQRRQRELDDRLGGSGAGAVVVAATTAEYNRDQPTAAHSQQLVGEHQQQQQQVPLLVDSAANQYHDHLSITNTNQNQYQHHDQYSGSVADAQQQVAFYPHQHQQQGGVGYLLEDPHQLAADDAAPLTSLLDLDEGAHNQLGYSHTSHHQQQQQQLKQEQTGGRLPASVIQVNNWHERKLSAQYDHYYGASSGSGGRLHSRADAAAAGQSVELTTLNSVAAASSDRSQQQQHLVVHHPTGGSHHLHPMNAQAGQHRRNDSMSSFNLSLNESTGSMLGPGSAVAYSGEQLECFGPTTAGALVGHDQLYEDDEDEPQFSQSKSYSASARTRHRTALRASSGQSRGRRQQQAGTPTNSDDADEFKVCEWHGCGNSFLEMRDFVRHLEERHVNMEPAEKNRFFCMWAECKRNNQEFNARYKLLIHMRVHSGEKPFTCDQSPHCKKSFSRLENLKIHKRSHTGEKPYRCNYEHCSKSFTNSSDRIKHHKTHKDPKPYTCTHEGCTKRYTDPSSLRKHLRAHKRHSDGAEVMNHRHLHTSSSSSSAAHNHYPPQVGHQNHLESYQPHHSHQYQHHQELSFSASYQTAREHMTPPQQQQLQPVDNYAQQQQQYSFGDQPSYASESYTTLEPKHMYEQQQQQQPYLQADYDPAKEFESALLNANDASSTLTQQEDQLGASFKRPQHRTDSTICRQSEQQQQQQQHGPTSYLAIPTRSPTVSQRLFSEAQARQHERLSRSWCAGNSERPAPAARRQHLVPSGASSSLQHPSSQNQYHIKPDHFGPQAQPCEWPSVGGQHNQQQVLVGQSFAPCDYQMTQQQQPPPVAANQQQHSWPTSSHYDGQVVARTSQRVQFQPHQQQQQQQQSRHMTRQQQHEQLMRSMPANVNFL